MEDENIIHLIERAIANLYKNDSWLIANDLSEQSISHKLAVYLQKYFPDFDVDCEYNGNVDRENNKKQIDVLKFKLEELGLLKESEKDEEKEWIERAVFPDIIVHARGTNLKNLCIIEIKKSTSKITPDYDKLKLECYTSINTPNDLKYQLGIFLLFYTNKKKLGKYDLRIFKEGKELRQV